jgi:hypothetical protein
MIEGNRSWYEVCSNVRKMSHLTYFIPLTYSLTLKTEYRLRNSDSLKGDSGVPRTRSSLFPQNKLCFCAFRLLLL